MKMGTQDPEIANNAASEAPAVFRFKRSHLYSLLIPLAFVTGLASGFLFWGRDAGPAAPSDPADERVDVGVDDDPSLGPEDAAVTIIEFGDFTCSFCRRFHNEIFPALLAEYQDQIRFVYRDFPVVGGGAVGAAAAHAADCANEQGAYWEYHNALFSLVHNFDDEGYEQYAQDLGLDLEAFQECQASGRYSEEVLGDYTDARLVNVSGTPTFFINGKRVIGAQPLAVFSQVIEEELNSQ